MSNYYLCDTCGVEHWPYANYGHWDCAERHMLNERLVMTDEYEHPHEVCPYWKPKEDE